MSRKSSIEIRFEHGLFAARWLMAPMYLGLAVALAMLVVMFVRELAYYAPQILTLDSEEVILAVLTLIDLSLAGNLLLIILFSGYENFVSKFDLDDGRERPAWMGTVDFSGLKMKLVASIVAISAISLLKSFMEVGEGAAIDQPKLLWMVVIHLTFVVSGVLLAVMDLVAAKTDKH